MPVQELAEIHVASCFRNLIAGVLEMIFLVSDQ